ncbi:haloacid dehalogenase type II [Motiliproteus sp. SC1-56]|uniref:haloacid dehalogenase type II n=1 Tax=Motiliproteus sp. SC1-56 TaxID=2799565 RepID=UPI001A8EF34E|nr:haloacid dehalogenase type II [Motiliproteus sp. SC1-56]
MSTHALALDVYGTLVDPLEVKHKLQGLVGEQAEELAAVWRQKQLEYSFRRGLMDLYEDFSVCTAQALDYAQDHCGVSLAAEERQQLLEQYQELAPFPDVIPALETFAAQGYKKVAFSNGHPDQVRQLLSYGGVLAHLDGVISVHEVEVFKPAPRVYQYLLDQLGTPGDRTWLVSSNPFDVIGAKAAGLRAAWVKRAPGALFDPWGIEPDLVVADLKELAQRLGT